MRDWFITKQKEKIDNGDYSRRPQLEAFLNDWAKEEGGKEHLLEYFDEQNKATAIPFSPNIGIVEWNQMDSPFEEPEEANRVVDFGPQYWFNYFFREAKTDTSSAEAVDAIKLLFNKVADTKKPVGYKFQLKDELRPTAVDSANSNRAHDFTFPNDQAVTTWQTALTKLLKAGFRAVPIANDHVVPHSLTNCMLEQRFVRRLDPRSQALEIFWRGDGRDSMHNDDWTRTVDKAADAERYSLDQPWHPYSLDTIRAYVWLRRANADNDYYTIVSVTAELNTAACFPKIDERRAYQMPLKPPAQWSKAELTQHAQHLAEVAETRGSSSAVWMATKSYVYMLATNSGAVINTQAFGDRGSGGFPERGVNRIGRECYIGQIPIIRLWHGYTEQDAFTALLHPEEKARIFVTTDQLENRYGSTRALEIKAEFKKAEGQLRKGVTVAWTSSGARERNPTPKVQRLLKTQIPPFRLHALKINAKT